MLKKLIPLTLLLSFLLVLVPEALSTSYANPVEATVVVSNPVTESVSTESLVTPAALSDPNSALSRAAEAAEAAARGTYPNGIAIQGGDVLITSNTSSAGLTGHAGIVTDASGRIASISGYGAHPAIQSMATWFANNPNTVVIRHNDVSLAHSAGSWAASYVSQHPDATYGLVNNLRDLNEVYCSKIPWLAYFSFGLNVGGKYTVGVDEMILPYEWLEYGRYNRFGLSVAATFGNW